MADQVTSWQPDPYGAHEFRFFSADGKPTLLVMDGGKTSYDKPPTTSRPPAAPSPATPELESPPTTEASSDREPEAQGLPHWALETETHQSPEPPPGLEPEPPTVPITAPAFAPSAAVERGSAEADTVHGAEADTVQPPSAAPVRAREAVPAVTDFADRSRFGANDGSPEPLSRPRKIAYIVVCAVLALSVLGLAYVHLRPTDSGHSAHSAASTTTSSSARTTTTTTVVLPTALQPGAEAAATALVSSWSTGNKAAALTVATTTAVADLFAAPYTSGLAIDRGCSTTFMPIVCTFGPSGGASPTDPIYEIDVSKTAGGWYVSSVKIEN